MLSQALVKHNESLPPLRFLRLSSIWLAQRIYYITLKGSKEVALESLKKDGLKGLWGSLVKMEN